MSEPMVLRLVNVVRRFGDLEILSGADLELRRGETVALLGPSGSGKSSLLHIAGLLEAPSAGEVEIAGRATSTLSDAEKTRLRRDALGFVYQFHHLLPEFSALANVALPQRIAGFSRTDAEDKAARLLTLLGLGERLTHQPAQLSGGEKQRVAIARALANGPAVLLADEPTGNLDPGTSASVFDALLRAVKDEGLSAIVATHDHALARRLDRVIEIRDKRLAPVRLDAAAE